MEDETHPLVPDPPFEIAINVDHKKIHLLVVPHWDDKENEAQFEIFQGEGRVGMIRRNREDVEGWDVVDGEIWEIIANGIGEQIDKHYFY